MRTIHHALITTALLLTPSIGFSEDGSHPRQSTKDSHPYTVEKVKKSNQKLRPSLQDDHLVQCDRPIYNLRGFWKFENDWEIDLRDHSSSHPYQQWPDNERGSVSVTADRSKNNVIPRPSRVSPTTPPMREPSAVFYCPEPPARSSLNQSCPHTSTKTEPSTLFYHPQSPQTWTTEKKAKAQRSPTNQTSSNANSTPRWRWQKTRSELIEKANKAPPPDDYSQGSLSSRFKTLRTR